MSHWPNAAIDSDEEEPLTENTAAENPSPHRKAIVAARRLLSGIKPAVRAWGGLCSLLIAYLIAAKSIFPHWEKLSTRISDFFGLPSAGAKAVAFAPLIILLSFYAIPELIGLLRKWREIKAGPLNEVYFRTRPYGNSPEDCAAFKRADGTHQRVLSWLKDTDQPILYLIGESGAGKSSLLQAYVSPNLKQSSRRRCLVPSRSKPLEEALRSELLRPGEIWQRPPRGFASLQLNLLVEKAAHEILPARLIITLDQFEGLLIAANAATAADLDPQLMIARDLISLSKTGNIKNLSVMLVVRKDFMPLLSAFRDRSHLPKYIEGENWLEVRPFLVSHARDFLSKSSLGLNDDLMDMIFRQIAQVEDNPHLVRPVTLNMVGVVLLRRALAGTVKLIKRSEATGFLRVYVKESITESDFMNTARPLLRHIISTRRTAPAQSVSAIAAACKREPQLINNTLVLLQQRGLVRCLDAERDLWDIAHDFLAKLIEEVVRTWRATAFQLSRRILLPVSIGVASTLLITAYLSPDPWYADGKPFKREKEWGETKLHAAATMGDLRATTWLITHNADVNAKTKEHGRTPLMYAASSGHEPIIRALLKRNPETLNEIGLEGETALHLAAWYGEVDAITALFKSSVPPKVDLPTKGKGLTPLHYAAIVGSPEVASLLVGKGASRKSRDMEGETPLHTAVRLGRLDMLPILADKEVANIVNNAGRAPLHDAAEQQNAEIFDRLLDAGADPELADNAGITPSGIAITQQWAHGTDALRQYALAKGVVNWDRESMGPHYGVQRSSSSAPDKRPSLIELGTPQFWRLAKASDETWWLLNPRGDALEFLTSVTTVQPASTGRAQGAKAWNYSYRSGVENRRPGDPVLRVWAHEMAQEVRAAGFKGIGAWSHPDLHGANIPMSRDLNVWKSVAAEGLPSHATDFQQFLMYDPAWPERLERVVARLVDPLKSNHDLVGYYLGNEVRWDRAAVGAQIYFRNRGSPQRRKVMDVIQTKWATLDEINRAFGTNFNSISEMELAESLPENCPGSEFLEAEWQKQIATDYFEMVTSAVRKHDPNHLILGARFHSRSLPPEVVRVAARFCDVNSLNYYPSADAELPDNEMDLLRGTGRPLIVSEYSIHSDENRSYDQNRAYAFPSVTTQKKRAEVYSDFTSKVAKRNEIVGADWFQWMDEPPSGRLEDGEDAAFGVVDLFGKPYGPLVERIRGLRDEINRLHGAKRLQAGQGAWTALHRVITGSEAAQLVAAGANPNVTAGGGWTPLHVACAADVGDVVKVLLDAGADPNAISDEGFTPLHNAWSFNVVGAMIGAGANAKAQTKSGWTVMHLAAARGRLDVVRFLALAHQRVDLNARGPEGFTALHLASASGNADVIRLLIVAGAKPDVVDDYGRTPLHQVGSYEAAAILVRSDPRCLRTRDKWGMTPVHCARFDSVAALFVDCGADVTSLDSWGRSPLHYAAAHGWPRVARWMIQKGANPSGVDVAGHAPWSLAADPATAEALVSVPKSGIRNAEAPTRDR